MNCSSAPPGPTKATLCRRWRPERGKEGVAPAAASDGERMRTMTHHWYPASSQWRQQVVAEFSTRFPAINIRDGQYASFDPERVYKRPETRTRTAQLGVPFERTRGRTAKLKLSRELQLASSSSFKNPKVQTVLGYEQNFIQKFQRSLQRDHRIFSTAFRRFLDFFLLGGFQNRLILYRQSWPQYPDRWKYFIKISSIFFIYRNQLICTGYNLRAAKLRKLYGKPRRIRLRILWRAYARVIGLD